MSGALDQIAASASAGAAAQVGDAGAVASLSIQLGRVEDAVTQLRREQARARNLRFIPIQPIVSGPNATGTALGNVVLANAEIWGPKTGYFWAVQSMRCAGLADSTSDNQIGAPAVIAAGAGAAALPAGSTLAGFTATFAAAITAGTVTVSGVAGGPYIYNVPVGATSFSQSYGAGLEAAAGAAPTVTVAGLGAVAGNLSVLGTTSGFNVDEISIYRTPAGITAIQNFMNELDAQNPIWHPGRTEFILQPGDFVAFAGTGLQSAQIACGFDVVIGTLDQLHDYLM
jgi:hypothetical protein